MDLIRKCIDGSSLAQKELYDMYRVRLFTLCLRYMPTRQDAEDVFQEAWVKIFTKLAQFDSNRGTFISWASRVFANTCLEDLRKSRQHFEEINESILIPSEASTIIDDMSLQDMLEVLKSMPLGYRTVFNLYVIEGYSHKEIAEKLNLSDGTSKSQLMRAKAVLRARVNYAFAI